jgi:AraC-like DNA-binding protein
LSERVNLLFNRVPMRTFGGAQILDMIAALGACGVDTQSACRAAGLNVAQLGEGARVPTPRVLTLLDDAANRTGDTCIGLHAAEKVAPSGTLRYLIMASGSLEEGLRRAGGFAGLMISTLRMAVVERGDETYLVYDVNDDAVALHRHAIDYLLMANLRSIQSMARRAPEPRSVHVRFPDPGDGEEQGAFGCPVYFGQPEMRLAFRSADLRQAPCGANPLVAAEIEKLSAALLAQAAAVSPLRVRVVDTMRRLLAHGVRPERAGVARRLGMSERTLQRGLEREGTTFKRERDAVVREAMQVLLADPALTIKSVAFNVGFREGGAFVKAFKRWTGDTPTVWRRRRLGGNGRSLPR